MTSADGWSIVAKTFSNQLSSIDAVIKGQSTRDQKNFRAVENSIKQCVAVHVAVHIYT